MNVVSALGSVNWIAVLLAVVVHTVLGGVWFAGWFAKPYAAVSRAGSEGSCLDVAVCIPHRHSHIRRQLLRRYDPPTDVAQAKPTALCRKRPTGPPRCANSCLSPADPGPAPLTSQFAKRCVARRNPGPTL